MISIFILIIILAGGLALAIGPQNIQLPSLTLPSLSALLPTVQTIAPTPLPTCVPTPVVNISPKQRFVVDTMALPMNDVSPIHTDMPLSAINPTPHSIVEPTTNPAVTSTLTSTVTPTSEPADTHTPMPTVTPMATPTPTLIATSPPEPTVMDTPTPTATPEPTDPDVNSHLPEVGTIFGEAFNGSQPVDANWYCWNSNGTMIGSGYGPTYTWGDIPWGDYTVGCYPPGGSMQTQDTWVKDGDYSNPEILDFHV